MKCPICNKEIDDPKWNQRFCSYRCQSRAHSIMYHKTMLTPDELILKNNLRLKR